MKVLFTVGSVMRLAIMCLGLSIPIPLPAAVVLQYHHISATAPAATRTSPELFEQHLTYLAEHNYRVVSLPQMLEQLQSGVSPEDRTVAITFDDGYRSVFTEAFPRLQARGWPFTIFVNTRPLDQGWQQFVSWGELREMVAAGGTIANHSVVYEHMVRRLGGESESQWRQRMTEDIMVAQARIAAETGQSHRLFAYPYGEYDLALVELLRELDFVGLGQHSGPLGRDMSRQALPRFPFGGIYGDLSDFVIKVGSLPLPVQQVTLTGLAGFVSPLLPALQSRPELRLELASSALASRLNCFATAQGAIPLRVQENTVWVQADRPLGAGRSRYNCTASADNGRFFWFSQPFIRRMDSGEWPEE